MAAAEYVLQHVQLRPNCLAEERRHIVAVRATIRLGGCELERLSTRALCSEASSRRSLHGPWVCTHMGNWQPKWSSRGKHIDFKSLVCSRTTGRAPSVLIPLARSTALSYSCILVLLREGTAVLPSCATQAFSPKGQVALFLYARPPTTISLCCTPVLFTTVASSEF